MNTQPQNYKILTPEEARQRVTQIKQQHQADMDQLFADVLAGRQFQDGQRLQRTRLNPDGSLLDRIEGIVVTGDVTLTTDQTYDFAYPNVHYWVRVTTPGYHSHQEYIRNRRTVIAYHQAEDFWQGDERWIAL